MTKAWQNLYISFFLPSPPSLSFLFLDGPRWTKPVFSSTWLGQKAEVRCLVQNCLSIPSVMFSLSFFMEARKTMSNRPQSNHLRWAHSEGINAFYIRMPSLRQSPLSNTWENSLSLHYSLLAPSPSVLLIEIIAVTHFTSRRARGSRSLTWFSWEGWFGHSGSDRSSIDSPLREGRGARRLHCTHGLLRKNKRAPGRQRPQWEQ